MKSVFIKAISLALSLALMLSLAACAAEPVSDEPGDKPKDKPENGDPEYIDPNKEKVTFLSAEKDEEAAEDGETRDFTEARSLALELMRSADGENPVVSPVSAYLALSMAAAGAEGETLEELKTLLGEDFLQKSLALRLGIRSTGSMDAIFIDANSIWIDWAQEANTDYINTLSAYFNADAYSALLRSEECKNAVNEWISEKTKGLIPEMLRQPMDGDLALINTIYMKAAWADKFESYNTYDRVFHAAGGDVTVPFMNGSGRWGYLSGEGYEGTLLPYNYHGYKLAFAVLKPLGQSAGDLLRSLDADELAKVDYVEDDYVIDISMPKLDIQYSMDMTDTLSALAPKAFDINSADFSGINSAGLYISKVLQKVRLIADEEGTEAAAATVIEMLAGSAYDPNPPVHKHIDLDEPFIYMIMDTEHHVPVFMGIATDP